MYFNCNNTLPTEQLGRATAFAIEVVFEGVGRSTALFGLIRCNNNKNNNNSSNKANKNNSNTTTITTTTAAAAAATTTTATTTAATTTTTKWKFLQSY